MIWTRNNSTTLLMTINQMWNFRTFFITSIPTMANNFTDLENYNIDMDTE